MTIFDKEYMRLTIRNLKKAKVRGITDAVRDIGSVLEWFDKRLEALEKAIEG